MRWRSIPCGGVLAAVLVVVGGCASAGEPVGGGQPVELSQASRDQMISHAKMATQIELASPTSASFPPDDRILTWMTYQPKSNITRASVIGQVDASNHFGAILRKTYHATWQEVGRVDGQSYRPTGEGVISTRVVFR